MSADTTAAPDVLLEAQGLKKYFPVRGGAARAQQRERPGGRRRRPRRPRGETLGLVGESGCGKSTLGRTLLRLLEPTEGRILFAGADSAGLSRRAAQDADPRHAVHLPGLRRLARPANAASAPRRRGARDPRGAAGGAPPQIVEVLDQVGLTASRDDRYPHQFCGGQRQRIGIARALVLRPRLVVADEPVSALDVSIQSQVLNLLSS